MKPSTACFSTTDGGIESVWSYDPTARSWKAHFAGGAASGSGSDTAAVPAGLSTLKTLEPGRAYWIKTTRATVLAPAAAPSGTALYYHPDHLGSTAFTTDADGNLLSETHYYPFGLPRLRTGTDASGAEYLHTDHELDSESGLIYSNARYRDPVVGRFVSVDPLFVEAPAKCDIQECNLYSYTKNNPIKWVDPKGLWTFQIGVTINGGASVGGKVSSGIVLGYSQENGISFGLYTTGGGGGHGGITAGGRLTLQSISKISTYKDVEGSSMDSGFDTPVFGAELSIPDESKGSISYSLNLGPDGVGLTPGSIHSYFTTTKVVDAGEIKNKGIAKSIIDR